MKEDKKCIQNLITLHQDISIIVRLIAILQKELNYFLHTKKEVQDCLSEYITEDGIINGTALKEHWFSISKKDVFISHSHCDINKVKAFAGWLYDCFELEAFIDFLLLGLL